VRPYSAADRASLQRTLIDGFARDERVEGVLVVGSGAHGFADEYSDVDLAVILRAGEPAAFALEWATRLESQLPVVDRFGDDRREAGYVVGLLLENFLEVDVGFLRMDQMAERGMPWAIAFDRLGDVERRQRALEPEPEDRVEAYRSHADGIWHWIMRCRVAIARGCPLLALTDLDEVRMRTLRVAAIRRGIGNRKYFDELPREVVSRVAESLPRALDTNELSRALTASAQAFFTEASALEAELGLDVASRLEPVVTAYLEHFERIGECASP
jgi:predicted nucleotidyltransferase